MFTFDFFTPKILISKTKKPMAKSATKTGDKKPTKPTPAPHREVRNHLLP